MRSYGTALALLLSASCASAVDHLIPNRDAAALRIAIEAAATDPARAHRIVLATDGLYTLDGARAGHLGLPPLVGKVSIDGRGAEIRRYSEDPMTLLLVQPGAQVEISNLTLAEGNLGAIRNLGSLALDGVKVMDSSGEAARGIIVNHGDLTASNSEFAYNQVHGSGRDAGTLVNFGTLRLIDTRIVNNTLSRRYPSLAAAAVLNHGRLHVSGCAFEGNDVLDAFGGLTSTSILNLVGGEVEGEADGGLRDERNEMALN